MITIRHRSQDLSKRIWLQFTEEGKEAIGAIHCEKQPEIEGYVFRPVSDLQLSGVFSESDDVLITFDDYCQVVKIEAHRPNQTTITQVATPTSIEHKGRQYGCSLWGKGSKVRLYVKTPRGNELGYFDLTAGEYVEQNAEYFSSKESASEFIEKVRQAAEAIQL